MSNLILPTRRAFITGLIAAPVIIAANKLMPVKSIVMAEDLSVLNEQWNLYFDIDRTHAFWAKDKSIEPNAFLQFGTKYVIEKSVNLPPRTNYKTIHAGSELLSYYKAPILPI